MVSKQLSFGENERDASDLHAPPPCLPYGAHATKVFNSYWRFAAERQNIFFKRLRGESPPWTDDQILSEHKFTNAYRASDRVSQYLIRNVIYNGDQEPEELFFRTLLFKLFNKIETWELLGRFIGELSTRNFDTKAYDDVLTLAIQGGKRIYSAAYIMPSGGVADRKHRTHLNLLQRMLQDRLPTKLQDCGSMQRGFELLRSYAGIGDFLAYQFIVDLNYSTLLNFSEMEFVVPGPGAKDGIRKCFDSTGRLNQADVIRMMADVQEQEFHRLGVTFHSLWGRRLQLIDCQNLFCEVDKYSRVAHPEVQGVTGRTRIKQKFRIHDRLPEPYYPPKWNLNTHLQES